MFGRFRRDTSQIPGNGNPAELPLLPVAVAAAVEATAQAAVEAAAQAGAAAGRGDKREE